MHYTERQRFRQAWLWVILLPSMLGTAGMFGYGLYHQLVLNKPWGDRPMSDTALFVSSATSISVSLGVLWLMVAIELRVEARDDALHIRFFPFLNRRIPYPDIRRAEARRYNPLLEYGGWGLRYGRHGKAYNVSGNWGVQLELASGERLLLGSQDADALSAAIRSHMTA